MCSSTGGKSVSRLFESQMVLSSRRRRSWVGSRRRVLELACRVRRRFSLQITFGSWVRQLVFIYRVRRFWSRFSFRGRSQSLLLFRQRMQSCFKVYIIWGRVLKWLKFRVSICRFCSCFSFGGRLLRWLLFRQSLISFRKEFTSRGKRRSWYLFRFIVLFSGIFLRFFITQFWQRSVGTKVIRVLMVFFMSRSEVWRVLVYWLRVVVGWFAFVFFFRYNLAVA